MRAFAATTPPLSPRGLPRHPSPLAILLGLCVGLSSGCAPVVRQASHAGAKSAHAHRSLVGPYDGQVLDAQSGEAIADASVVASWDYDEGQGLIAPLGREIFSVRSDAAGRYRIPSAPLRKRSSTARLVAFTLSVSKPGYRPYRSDQDAKGRQRHDFSQRNHAIKLEPALPSDSAMTQLLYLRSSAASTLEQASLRKRANLELYRLQNGLAPSERLPQEGEAPKEVTNPPAPPQWLDASALLDADGLRTRTGSVIEFKVQDLNDLPRSPHYHGVHFRAKDRDVQHDFAYRIWFEAPEGLESIAELLKQNLPNAQQSEIIGEQSWTFENDELRAVAFVDPEQKAAVLLTCGVKLCQDLDTAVLVAHHLARNLDQLKRIDAQTQSPSPAAAKPKVSPSTTPQADPSSPAAKSEENP